MGSPQKRQKGTSSHVPRHVSWPMKNKKFALKKKYLQKDPRNKSPEKTRTES